MANQSDSGGSRRDEGDVRLKMQALKTGMAKVEARNPETDMRMKLRQFFERHDAQDKVRGYIQNVKMKSDFKEPQIGRGEEDALSLASLSSIEGLKKSVSVQFLRLVALDKFETSEYDVSLVVDVELRRRRFRSGEFEAQEVTRLGWTVECDLPNDVQSIVSDTEMKVCISTTYPDTEFVGLCVVDWRSAFKQEALRARVDCHGLHNEVVCCLEFEIQLRGITPNIDWQNVLHLQSKQRKLDVIESEREFAMELKAWMQDLVRLTKNTATPVTAKEIGSGKSIVFNNITPYVDRSLMNQGQCLRYCYHMRPLNSPIGGLILPNWAVVASGCAGPRERVNVLASLLRGFGLNAYVMISRPRSLVVTFSEQKPTFFDVLTGRFHSKVPQVITEVTYLYNEQKLFANLKPETDPRALDWNVENPLKWKQLLAPESAVLQAPPVPTMRRAEVNDKLLEFQVKQIIAAERMKFALQTSWSSDIEKNLLPLVYSYEHEKGTGKASAFHKLLSEALRDQLRPLHSIKATPAMLHSTDPREIFRCLMNTPCGLDILGVREKNARFALCIASTHYSEGVFCVWAILAVESMLPLNT